MKQEHQVLREIRIGYDPETNKRQGRETGVPDKAGLSEQLRARTLQASLTIPKCWHLSHSVTKLLARGGHTVIPPAILADSHSFTPRSMEEARTREEWPDKENISFVCETNRDRQRMLVRHTSCLGLVLAQPLVRVGWSVRVR